MDIKSLKARKSELADTHYQLSLLANEVHDQLKLPWFKDKLAAIDLWPLKPTGTDIMQINVGKMCNQACAHCHVDAGPDRKEIMTRATMQLCLDALEKTNIQLVDLTGGAPEMNPDFRWFVSEIRKRGRRVMVRCNLTIIVANKKYYDLPEFFKEHQVEVVSSLPFYNADKTDRQRGKGVFEASIKALKMLNEVGYGKENSGLILNLVYNPSGAFLPGSQESLKLQFKKTLASEFGIVFNDLFAITNMPISRYLEYLMKTDNYEGYIEKLINAFNPSAAMGVMCRNTISVGWEGSLHDCDFNQQLELGLEKTAPQHIKDFDVDQLNARNIVVNEHCYGCTAGAGSSCGGATA